MVPSIYTPLPSSTSYLNIRLIRLQPSDDPAAPICCKLVCYPLVPERSHLYECLSYVWGSPDDLGIIRIDSPEGFVDFDVTQNLYAALIALRDPIFERILWIDAICINQKDENEKAQQVVSMTRIYGLASRVVIWLGEEANQSTPTFRELRKLAQQQQPVTGHSQDNHPNLSANNSKELRRKDTCDVLALLSRAYFRRMWVLQEVTAARSVLFKCGPAELQGATFLAGLDGLPPMDHWRLRNRIRAFILLIQRSAFRENLKGQNQLHIDPLMNLIDRFHSHQATDIRDKIFALWGLSTESELTSILRPDYSKSWEKLLIHLGIYVFGKGSNLHASKSKHILYARSRCHYLGKVMTVYDAGLWDMEQRLEIASMRLSKFLESDGDLTLTIKMRSSAEEIRQHDIVFFLPQTNNLIFARSESVCLRIISIIESHSVQITTDKFSEVDQQWRPWQPFLESRKRGMMDIPFFWSWEEIPVQGSRGAWSLMRDYFSSSIPQAHDDAQDVLEVEALSEMAILHMQMDNYNQACHCLNDIINGYDPKRGTGVDTIGDIRERLNIALSNRSMYIEAKNFLISRERNTGDPESPGAFELCFNVIIHAGMHVLIEIMSLEGAKAYIGSRSIMQLTATHIWIEFAALIISQGIGKDLILSAINMCVLDWERLHRRLSPYYGAMQSRDSFRQEDVQLLPRTSGPHNDYLGFLLLLSDHNHRLSETELSTALKAGVNSQNFGRLMKHSLTTVVDLYSIMNDLSKRKDRVECLISVLQENADRISMTFMDIETASQWDQKAARAVLQVLRDGQRIKPSILDILLLDQRRLQPWVLRECAGAVKTEWSIGESETRSLFRPAYPSERRNDDLILFMENKKITMKITEPVLEDVLSLDDDTFLFLMYRQDPSITNGRYILDKYGRSRKSAKRMLKNLALLQDGARPIQPGQDALTISNTQHGYAQLLTLLRYRRKEIVITAGLFIRTVVLEQALPSSRKSNIIETIGCCLVRHATKEEINGLIESSDMLSIIASEGYVRIMEKLRRRVPNVSAELEVFSQVTMWSHSVNGKNSTRQFHGSKTHRELIESLRTMSVPLQLQETLLKLACSTMKHGDRYDVLGGILNNNVIRAPMSLEFQETLLRLVLSNSCLTALDLLLKHKVIGANATFRCRQTTLHLVVLYHCVDLGSEISPRVVDIVMQHGGAASIDAKDAEGKTPRQMVEKLYKKAEVNRESYWKILRIFEERAPKSRRQ